MYENTMRKVEKMFSTSLIWPCTSAVISAPVSVSSFKSSASAASMRSANTSSLTEPSPAIKKASTKPGSSRNSEAVGWSKSANVDPPGDEMSPYDAIPTKVNWRAPFAATTRTVSPTTNSPLSAVARSSIISVAPTGRRPSSICQSPAVSKVAIPPNVGGPPPSLPSGVPSLPMTRANC